MAFKKAKLNEVAALKKVVNELIDELNTRGIADISFDNSSPSNGEQLTYNSTTGKYEPDTA